MRSPTKDSTSIVIKRETSLEAALAEAGEDSEARAEVYNNWYDMGYVYTCESADDLLDNCISRTQNAFKYLNEEEASARGDSCQEEATTPIEIAMENLDCQGHLDAMTGRIIINFLSQSWKSHAGIFPVLNCKIGCSILKIRVRNHQPFTEEWGSMEVSFGMEDWDTRPKKLMSRDVTHSTRNLKGRWQSTRFVVGARTMSEPSHLDSNKIHN